MIVVPAKPTSAPHRRGKRRWPNQNEHILLPTTEHFSGPAGAIGPLCVSLYFKDCSWLLLSVLQCMYSSSTSPLALVEHCINFKISQPHFAPLSLLIYSLPCMFIILLVLSGCQIAICSLFRLLALHSAPAASASQLLKSGIRSLSSSNVYQPRHFSSTSRDSLFPAGLQDPNHLAHPFLRLRFSFPLTIVRGAINYIHLLTYLLLMTIRCVWNDLIPRHFSRVIMAFYFAGSVTPVHPLCNFGGA